MVQYLYSKNTGNSNCTTTRVVKSIQAIPTHKTNSQSDYASKQSYIDQKVRKSCNTVYEPSNPQYAMDGAASSSQRVHTLRHSILHHETRRDFNGNVM